MIPEYYYIAPFRLWIILTVLFIYGCDNNTGGNIPASTRNKASSDVVQNIPEPVSVTSSKENRPDPATPNLQFNIGNKSYLFDVSNHSLDELEALLGRAEEITQATSGMYNQLEIVMILHGPDIEWFTQDNYENNKQLVDLAARLDNYEIIDMKVCETAMRDRGVMRDEIPDFIESVPYAPDFMKRMINEGYINL